MEVLRGHMWVIWWMGQHIPILFSDSFSCSQTGAWPLLLVQEKDTLHFLLYSKLLHASVESLQGSNIHLGIKFVLFSINFNQNHLFNIPEDVQGAVLNFFFHGKIVWCHSMDCHYIPGSKWWFHDLSPVTICERKSIPIPLISSQQLSSNVPLPLDLVFWCQLCCNKLWTEFWTSLLLDYGTHTSITDSKLQQ